MNLEKHSRALLQWLFFGAVVGAICGVASAAFLIVLEHATKLRNEHEWLVYTLPLAGVVIGAIYQKWGASIRGGNNLVLDTVHEDSPQLPLRMSPMVLIGTVLTHIFGGSAGREGTAVQMGASLADAVAHLLKGGKEARRQILAAGIAGGFGSVFGTPIAGTIFGLEVVCVGRVEYDALVPCLVSAVVGDFVTRWLGVVHTPYPTVAALPMTPLLLGKWLICGLAMAGASIAFIELTHWLKRIFERRFYSLPARMFVGGCIVVALWKLVGTSDYLGLGVPTIVRSFTDPNLVWYAFAAKIVFTAVTLSCGFLGGEVTPLFFIGAALGSVLGRALGIPIDMAAGVGMAAVFAAAANTPLALSIMAVELLGANVLPHVVIVAVVAYLISGHRGIYPAQRISQPKGGGPGLTATTPLRDLHLLGAAAPPPVDIGTTNAPAAQPTTPEDGGTEPPPRA
jgi:H+/Cl- antiporter ClcA